MPRTDEHFGPLASVLYERDEAHKRIAALEAGLRDALGAIWELHRWDTRENYERDLTVKRINALLQKSEPKK